MSAPIFWAAAGLLLMVAEVLLPGIFLVWIGLSALIVGALAWAFALGGMAQVLAFVLVLAAIMGVIWKSGLHRRRQDSLNAPAIGTVGRLVHALDFSGGEGRVRLGDSDWLARVEPGAPDPAPGTQMMVVGVEGIRLVVR